MVEMSELLRRAAMSGTAAAIASGVVAALCARAQTGHAAGPLNAVSHIAWGGSARRHARHDGLNTAVGWLLHHGAGIFWATGFEALFGRRAEQSRPVGVAGGAATAAVAYVVDYHLVPERFVPRFEARLEKHALLYIYAGLAAGFALGARSRGWLRRA
jgi:hypothetical protein